MRCKTAINESPVRQGRTLLIAGQPCGKNAVRGHDLCKKHLAMVREWKWKRIFKEGRKDAKEASI